MGATKLMLLGAPGAGKGTLAKMIEAKYGLPQLSTGDMLRDAVKKGTELGSRASRYMNEGELVPDEIVIGILRQRLTSADCEKGFVLDGFPRTMRQADALGRLLRERGISLDAVINLEAPNEILIQRLSGRRQCQSCGAIYHVKNMPPKRHGVCDICGGKLYQRNDDKRETIEVRLEAYRRETEGLVDFYRGAKLLKSVRGDKDPETAFDEVKQIVEGTRG